MEDKALGSRQDAHYLTKVLRLHPGKKVKLLDGQGNVYLSEISNASNHAIEFQIIQKIEEDTEPSCELVLAQGLCKKDNFELVIQKATELGVSRIIPMITDFTDVKLKDDGKIAKRRERWQVIAKNAAEQCKRLRVPEIDGPQSFQNVLKILKEHSFKYKFMLYEVAVTPFKEVIEPGDQDASTLLLIGPEGGFSAAEVDVASQAGVLPVSMGPRILRTETAGIVATAIVMYVLADLGGDVNDRGCT